MKKTIVLIASLIIFNSAFAGKNETVQAAINSTGGNCPSVTRINVDSKGNMIYAACSNGQRFAILVQGSGGKVLNCRSLEAIGGRCEL